MSEIKVVSVLPSFAGSDTKNVTSWIAQYRAQIAATVKKEEVEATCLARFALHCDPTVWAFLNSQQLFGETASWENLVKQLTLLYVPDDLKLSSLGNLQRRTQQDGESVMEYYQAFCILAGDAGVKISDYKPSFTNGLKPAIRQALALLDLETINDVVSKATRAERAQVDARPPAPPAPVAAADDVEELVAAAYAQGHREGFKQRRSGPPARFEGTCYNCQKRGHKKADCRAPAKPDEKSSSKSFSSKFVTRQYSKTSRKPRRSVIVANLSEQMQRGPTAQFFIGGSACSAVIDSGAARSLVSAQFAAACGLVSQRSPTVRLVSASKAPIPVKGELSTSLEAKGLEFPVDLIIVEDLVCNMLLGRDFMQRHHVVLDLNGNRLQLRHSKQKRMNLPYCVQHQHTSAIEGVCSTEQSESLPFEQRAKWAALREEFSSCFAESSSQYALADVEPMEIRLVGDPKPIRRRPYRLSQPEREAVDKQVKEWLEAGIIRPSKSQWAFPCKVVPKGENEWRMVVDFSQLGNVTADDAFPAPYASSIFDRFAGCKVFSVCDLQHAYLQVPVAEESQHLLSFVTEDEQYEFCRVPFGFKNSGAALQRALADTLRGIKGLHGYADDWMIATPTWDQHWIVMKTFLERIKQSGFLLKPSKCQIGQERVKFLGREVSGKGVHLSDSGVQTVLSIPTPTCTAELRVFLGGFQWFSPFIPQFAELCAPLNKLRSEKSPWSWGEEQQQAFEKLRKSLTEAPVLRHPDFSKPFTVETDASGVAVGAVLMQEGHPVAYAGRCLKPAERQIGITALELTAVVFAIEHWHVYLHGRPFTLVTDHKSLEWLRGSKNLSGKLAQWALLLQEYNFKVVHRPGLKHGLSDTISRLAVGAVEVAPVFEDLNGIIAAQASDPECSRCIRILKGAKDGERGEVVRQFIIDPDGVLCLLVSKYQRPYFRPWIPASMVPMILKRLHDESGHLGVGATQRKASQSFHWPSMTADVKEYVAACPACQGSKGPAPSRQIKQGTVTGSSFNDMVALDLFSGLMQAPGGYNHILVIMDYFTRFAVAVPMRTKTAVEVMTAYQSNWVGIFGPPNHLLSDQGPEFTSDIFKGTVASGGTKKEWTTPYHPQTDGLVERFNRTLKSMLAASCNGDEASWTSHLAKCVVGYNATPNEVTNVSPYYCVFASRPGHLDHGEPSSASERAKVKNVVNRDVTEQHESRVGKIEARNAALTKPVSFRIGQLVLVRDPSIRQGAFKKLALEWGSQPFRVIGKPTMYNVLVEPTRGGNPKTVNLQNVKDYKPPWKSPKYIAPKQKNGPTPQATSVDTRNIKPKANDQIFVQVQTSTPTSQSKANVEALPEPQTQHTTVIAQQPPTPELQENTSDHNRLEPATPVENSNRYDLATPTEKVAQTGKQATTTSKVSSLSSELTAPAPQPTAVPRSSSSATSRAISAPATESAGRAAAPAKGSQQVTTAYGRTVKPTEKALGPK